MNDIERGVQRIEEGDAWEDTDEMVEVEVKRPLGTRCRPASRVVASRVTLQPTLQPLWSNGPTSSRGSAVDKRV